MKFLKRAPVHWSSALHTANTTRVHQRNMHSAPIISPSQGVHQRNMHDASIIRRGRNSESDLVRCPATTTFSSIFELAAELSSQSESQNFDALNALFDVQQRWATCIQPQALQDKYGVDKDQQVVSITNRATMEQTWFNKIRTQKPQTFSAAGSSPGIEDPTDSGRSCDFCDWQNLTASDVFGRVETERCVTASNLFKYCAPWHGLIIMKNHHPLEFDEPAIQDLVTCASEWFNLAINEEKKQGGSNDLYPFLLWNCLARAGASQFHGHAQVMVSHVPFPQMERMEAVLERWPGYYDDVLRAHHAAGLLMGCGAGRADKAWAFVNLSSTKDMEIVIHSRSLETPGLPVLLHAALRTLIDDFGAVTFNVGVLNNKQSSTENHASSSDASAGSNPEGNNGSSVAPVVTRIVSRGNVNSKASDFGGLEVFAGASIGHTDPYIIADKLRQRLEGEEGFQTALDV